MITDELYTRMRSTSDYGTRSNRIEMHKQKIEENNFRALNNPKITTSKLMSFFLLFIQFWFANKWHGRRKSLAETQIVSKNSIYFECICLWFEKGKVAENLIYMHT